jgi:hypothetical protein
MKTISKILIAVSMLTLSLQVTAKPRTTLIKSNAITYKVVVHMENHVQNYVRYFNIIISDENGRIVAPPQMLTPGVSVYTFKEAGPAKGTRTASLSNGTRPISGFFLCNPDSHTGVFFGGNTYTFNLNILLNLSLQDQNSQIE